VNIHEYQGKEIFKAFGIPVAEQEIVSMPEGARDAAGRMGTVVVKAVPILPAASRAPSGIDTISCSATGMP
jgi:succinyl-CoA synthetase beta subunit